MDKIPVLGHDHLDSLTAFATQYMFDGLFNYVVFKLFVPIRNGTMIDQVFTVLAREGQ